MSFASPSPRRCLGSVGASPLGSFTIRAGGPRKVRFDAWQQELGSWLGHRASHDDTVAFLLACAEVSGVATLSVVAEAHFASAGHGAPPGVGEGPKA